MKSIPKTLLLLLITLIIIPQVVFAAWWNPFSWKVFKHTNTPRVEIQKKDPPSEIEKLRSEIEELKKKTSAPTIAQPKLSTPIGNIKKLVTESTAQDAKLSNSQIITKVKPATVYIATENGSGSGMIFTTDGYVLTNSHVVKGVSVAKVSLSTGEVINGTVIGRDEVIDLAVIKLDTTKQLPKIDFGDSDKTQQGDEVFAFGFPFGIEGDVSFKEGTISRRIENHFETSAEVHPGNSGGPLVNRQGQVVGINTAIFGKSISGIQLGETIKLAIPINIANNLIADLKAGRNIVVESQEEKQTRQEIENKSACLVESEQYYKKTVDSINQLNANNSDIQSLLLQIDQQIESRKRSLNDDIARITSSIDSTISELRRIAEKQIAGYQNSLIRSKSGASGSEVYASSITDIQSRLAIDIANYESQKQGQISLAQSSVDISIAKYAALKAKVKSDRDKSTENALANAKTKKTQYYQECMNK